MTKTRKPSMADRLERAATRIDAFQIENCLLYELLGVQTKVIDYAKRMLAANAAGDTTTTLILLADLHSLEQQARDIGDELTAHIDAK